MVSLKNSRARIEIRKSKGLGFPYPLKGHHRNKSNIIGEIPINQLTGADYNSMLKSAPLELKTAIEKERSFNASFSSHTYYEIRDNIFLHQKVPATESFPDRPGYIYAFIFSDYDADFRKCANQDEAKTKSIQLSIKRGSPINRAYKLLSRGYWKRAKGVA